jgi:hypothetical protein
LKLPASLNFIKGGMRHIAQITAKYRRILMLKRFGTQTVAPLGFPPGFYAFTNGRVEILDVFFGPFFPERTKSETFKTNRIMAKENIAKENPVVDALRKLKEEESELMSKLKPVQEAIGALEKIVDKSVKKPKPAKENASDAVEEGVLALEDGQ